MSSDPFPKDAEEGRLVLRTSREEVEAAQQQVIAAIERRCFDAASCFAIRLALEEAVSNAVKHGNRDDAAKNLVIAYRVEDLAVSIDVEDQGEGFDPASVPDPTEDENLEIPSGRGIMLMRAYMTHVEFNARGNRVTLVFQRPRNAKSA